MKYFIAKNPKIIAQDLHPEYQSTKYIQQLSASAGGGSALGGIRYTLYAIQHHHAHIVSCMAENRLKNQKVIGVAFDGTGLGIDNTLWGGEFLLCDYRDFKRLAHLREIPLLGQEKAIQEPARLAAAWLYLIYKDRFLNLDIGLVKKIKRPEWRVLKNMYLSRFNSPLTSSMGRLFDAVASLVLERTKVAGEAELAIELEKIAKRYALNALPYKFNIIKKEVYIIDPLPIFKGIISDLKARETKEKIAYRFHLTVAQMIREMSSLLRKKTRINKVILSGGVFQNNLLRSLSIGLLYKDGFDVLTHKDLSCNDSAISLGQLAVANYRG